MVDSVRPAPAPESAALPARPAPALVHRLFEAQAARTPDAPALLHAAGEVSYGELDARANRLARHLRGLGVGAEVPVGVFCPRTAEMVIALLGTLKAGGAYVPLDPAYPAERVAFMLAETGVRAVVTVSALAGRLPSTPAHLVVLDRDADAIASEDAGAVDAAVHPESLAYVIYTSGSTGWPKGVQIEHRSAVARLRWMRDFFTEAERAAVLCATSVCFDVSVAEVFGTLCWGGKLVLAENALSLASLPAGHEVRTACMVPAAAAELLRLGAIPSTVRTLALGGEPVPPDLARGLYALGTVERVLNLYGPTEDTTYSTCKPLGREDGGRVTVGRPLPGTHAHVLDPAGIPVAAGAEGEVWLDGAGLARGYLRRPAPTAERFVPNPFGAAGSRMYRTGDVGRLREDGELECLGRLDQQVKVRGFRVEPGEVEAVLREHPAVDAAAVVVRDDAPGGRALVAYVAARDGAASATELRARVAARLPEHMVPAHVEVLPALPLTPNGKVDRRALPAPRRASADASASAESTLPAEMTETQRRLAAIWAEVLGVDGVTVDADLFALGGHSLQATQIVARVRREMGVELPLPAIFATPTVEGIARVVEAARAERPDDGVDRIPRADRTKPIPLSAAQEAIRFFEELSRGMRSYDFQATVAFRGRLDARALEAALNEIVRRHEIFRTTFPVIDAEAVQAVHAPWAVHLPITDLSGLPEDGRRAEMERRMRAGFLEPFRLERLPLVRWHLYRLAEGEHVLAAAEHHFVHDGWSFGVFLRELTALYEAFAAGRPSPLPDPEIQFADYAVWQRARLAGGKARAGLDWWAEKLAGLPAALELPTDRPRPPAMSFRGASRRVRLDPGLVAAAEAFALKSGATLYMTLLAAFQALLSRRSGQDDFCVGAGVAGRDMRETEGLIGMVVNTVPLRARLDGDPEFREVLARVRETALEAYAHQEVPFGEIVEAVRPERALDRLPIYQVSFSFHDAPYPRLELPGLRLEVTEAVGIGAAKFDLQVIVIPRAHQHAGEGITMIWEYATDLFDPATVDRMAEEFQTLLAAAVTAPATRLSDLPLLHETEERRIASAWNDTDAPYPRDATLPELFERWAAETPDAPALVFGGETLTYAETDAAANQLAWRLRERGVGAEGRVGVCLERSAELAVAVLAALKAGAAYVPLDADYPRERLEHMVRDAGIAVVVTRSSLAERLPDGVERLELDGEDADAAPLPKGAPPRISSPDMLAHVIYTSGSTGTPKGVGITHRGVVRLVCGADYAPFAPGDRVAQLSSPSFDAYTFEAWGALLNGAALVGVPRDVALHPAALAGLLRREHVTAALLTTALFNQVARELPGAFTGVRHLYFGGEAADAAAVRRVLAADPPERLVNLYGPSEGTVVASWHRVESLDADATAVPIGLPVGNTSLHVLDERGRLAPVGVPGELHVGGDGVARGYLGRPAQTAAAFVPDPFSARPGARLYRTGDRVRRREDGALEFVGRVDRQVKLRGFRVEPGEIEGILRAHPAVADCVVDVVEAAGDRHLAAWAVLAPGAEADAAGLREWVAARVPAHAVPAGIALLPRLPLTPNGKVDRRALAAPEVERSDARPAPVPPATRTEARVAGLWAEVLGTDEVGVEDDFFALGGHSLRAMRLVARVREAFGVDLTVRALFDAPTVRALAAELDRRTALSRGEDAHAAAAD
ncbi:MAG TPA: amino acid adenylation domain-containing protein [Longimicrobiaceae bacterium]|jgi:amino acid adenylation domain-containing protein|nr:amino acid adenylation domain-containing protein [Longimicrobiaceae bacterium]